MAIKFKSFREESKTNWGVTIEEREPLTDDQLRTGAMLRMADATEKIAADYDAMRRDRDNYREWHKQGNADKAKLYKTISALQGVITKQRKKLAGK